MASLERRIHLLGQCDRSAVVSILIGAIPAARAEERAALCRCALVTEHPAALASVIRHLHRLDGEERVAIESALGACRDAAALDGAIEIVLGRATPEVARNVVAVIRARRDPHMAGRLSAFVAEGGDLAQEAADVLLDLTIEAAGVTGRRRSAPERRAAVEAAVRAALAAPRRERPRELLVAGAVLAARAHDAALSVDDDAAPDRADLRGAADQIDHAVVRRNLVRWLATDRLGRAAGRRMHEMRGAAAFSDLLHDGHLLRAPARRRMLAMAIRPLQCIPPPAVAVALDARAQRALPDLIDRLDLTDRTRVARLADLLVLPDAAARLRAAWAILARRPAVCGSSAVDEAIAAFASDRDRTVARAASVAMLAREPAPDRLEELAAAGHAMIRRRARERAARRSMDALLHHRGGLGPAALRVAARCALDRESERATASLRRALVAGDGAAPDEIVARIMLVRRLGLTPQLEDVMMDLAGAAHPHVASAAVAALASGRDDRRHDIVVAALRRDDGRIRANALETLRAMAPAVAIAPAEPAARSADGRLRAAAVLTLLRARLPSGVRELERMLADVRPMHRVAALWVAKTAREASALDLVRQLACGDRVPEVRVRARAVESVLLAAPASIGQAVLA
jgi:hypothetical protein